MSASKKNQEAILDQVMEVTDWNRDHAHQATGPTTPGTGPSIPPPWWR